MIKRILFVGTNPIRKFLQRYLRHKNNAKIVAEYNHWASENNDRCFVDGDSFETKFTVVVPAYNTDERHLREMVYTVVNQHYQNWELIIVNASTGNRSKHFINSIKEIDNRIKVIDAAGNQGISGNTNIALDEVDGEYTVFVDHDDLLHPCALHSFAESVAQQGAPSILYSDEDKVSDDGDTFFNPFFKPDWSPNLFENVNYINHLAAIETGLVTRVGGLRSKYDGAQDYDLLLRVIDEIGVDGAITHIPRILYHWRAAATSTANDISSKKYVLAAGAKALNDHLVRKGIAGKSVAIKDRPGFYKTVYSVDKKTKVALVVGATDRAVRPYLLEWLEHIVHSIPNLNTIYIGDWCTVANINKIKIINYNESGDTLSLKDDIIVYCAEAYKVSDKKVFSNMVGLASRGFAVAPVVVRDGRIATVLEQSMYPDFTTHYNGRIYGEGTIYGSTEWVRDVDLARSNVIVMPAADFALDIDRVKTDKVIIWSHDPLNSLGVFSDSRVALAKGNPNYVNENGTTKMLFKGCQDD